MAGDTARGVWIAYRSALAALRSLSRLRSRRGPYGSASSSAWGEPFGSAWSFAWSRRSSCASALPAERIGPGDVDGPGCAAAKGWPGEGCNGSLEDVVVAPGVVTVCSDPRELKNAGIAG